MAEYASTSAEAKALKGVHLYHFFISNCSQRARFALELKGVPWTSHHVDLPAGAHLTPGYREINPNCVVPTLVHDGKVILESNDIIAYVDETFEGPALMPAGPADREAVEELVERSTAFQPAIKALSYHLLFRQFRTVTAEDVDGMRKAGAAEALVAFMRDYSENGAPWQARVDTARADMAEALAMLESRLAAGHEWLSGGDLGLADVSWAVNFLRLEQCGIDYAPYPHVRDWGERIKALPAFRKAVIDYAPG